MSPRGRGVCHSGSRCNPDRGSRRTRPRCAHGSHSRGAAVLRRARGEARSTRNSLFGRYVVRVHGTAHGLARHAACGDGDRERRAVEERAICAPRGLGAIDAHVFRRADVDAVLCPRAGRGGRVAGWWWWPLSDLSAARGAGGLRSVIHANLCTGTRGDSDLSFMRICILELRSDSDVSFMRTCMLELQGDSDLSFIRMCVLEPRRLTSSKPQYPLGEFAQTIVGASVVVGAGVGTDVGTGDGRTDGACRSSHSRPHISFAARRSGLGQ